MSGQTVTRFLQHSLRKFSGNVETMLRSYQVKRSQHCSSIGWKNFQAILRLCWGHTRSKGNNIESHFREMFKQCRDYWDHMSSNGCKIEPYFCENFQTLITLLRLSWDHVWSNGPNIKTHFLRECSDNVETMLRPSVPGQTVAALFQHFPRGCSDNVDGQCWDHARWNGRNIVLIFAEQKFR